MARFSQGTRPVRIFRLLVLGMLAVGCGARSHGPPGARGDGDTDVDVDADAGTDPVVDVDAGDTIGTCGEGNLCALVQSANYRDLEGPSTVCASNSGFVISFRHGIGSHECSEMIESVWRIERPIGGQAVFNVRVYSHICYCEDLCCPGGCGSEDVFRTEVFIPTVGFGVGAYYVNVGSESITVLVDDC